MIYFRRLGMWRRLSEHSPALNKICSGTSIPLRFAIEGPFFYDKKSKATHLTASIEGGT